MAKSAARVSGARSVASTASPAAAVGGGGRRPLALLISPKPARLAQIRSAAQEALPGAEAIVCTDAARALARAETVRHFGWTPAIFVFDYRGGHDGDLADQLRLVRETEPDAELLVLIEDGDITLWRAAMEVVHAADKLTFLFTPFYRPDAVNTLRALAGRHALMSQRDVIA